MGTISMVLVIEDQAQLGLFIRRGNLVSVTFCEAGGYPSTTNWGKLGDPILSLHISAFVNRPPLFFPRLIVFHGRISMNPAIEG